MVDIKIKSYNVCAIEFSSLIETFPGCKPILNLIRIDNFIPLQSLIEHIDDYIDIYDHYSDYEDNIKTKLKNMKEILSSDYYKNCLLDTNK